MGFKFSAQNYVVDKEFGRNPEFFFDLNSNNATNASGSSAVPYRVQLGNRFPTVDLDNNVYGLYIQDDWQLTDKLELNLGIRWDYEDNANNVDYVTPANVRAGLLQWIASTDGGKPAGYAPAGSTSTTTSRPARTGRRSRTPTSPGSASATTSSATAGR